MSNKAKNSPKPPAFNIEQIKQALSKGGKNEIKLDDIDLHSFKPTSSAVLKRINALKNEQVKFAELEAKFFEEMHALECKYQQMYQPIFEKRRQIVNGEYEPTVEESKWELDQVNGHAEEKNKENGGATENADEKEEKGIPNFWLETMQSLRMTSELVQEPDEAILAYLQDIQVQYFQEKPYGYRLEFYFAENPYFTNKVLTKTYELKIEVDSKDPFSFEGPDLDKVTGCKIDWKTGKNVTVKLIKKKLKSKNKKVPPKVVTKEEKQDSFFNFFDSPKCEKNGDEKAVAIRKNDHHGDEDDENDDNDEILMFADFEIAQQIREKIVPKAVLYFTGELDDMDEDDYDDYDEDEDDEEGDEDDHDDEEDEDEDDDDEDDDDEDDNGKKGGKNKKQAGGKHAKGGNVGKLGGAGKGGEPTPSECKQN